MKARHKITLVLDEAVWARLEELCIREHRNPARQITWILEHTSELAPVEGPVRVLSFPR